MIGYKENGRQRFTITLDGEPWKEVHSGVFGKPPKLPASVDEWPKLEVRMASVFILKRLSSRHYPSGVLRQKLKERLVSSEAIEQALSDTSAYYDDKLWAENFVRSELKKAHGPRLIAYKLRAKGLDQNLIDKALIPAYEQQGELVAQLREKYTPQSLIRRGFELN